MSLSIAYITSRRDCRIEWFFDSLKAQTAAGDIDAVIVVDRYASERSLNHDTLHVPPKPSVWAGPHRLTREDWWNAASQRNTALCLCRSTHIAYVDDLSVLMPGWFEAAKEAARLHDTITCGRYAKVKNLVVENGEPVSFDAFAGGMDNRAAYFKGEINPCGGNCLYGCSLVAPVEALLSVDGWPEMLCDGLSFEDCCLGIVLANAGYKLRYDKRLFSIESEELHFVEPPMKRRDFGVSPNDKSHAALNIALQSKTFHNGFDGGIRSERERVLNGEPFMIKNTPEHEWYTSTPLPELEAQ